MALPRLVAVPGLSSPAGGSSSSFLLACTTLSRGAVPMAPSCPNACALMGRGGSNWPVTALLQDSLNSSDIFVLFFVLLSPSSWGLWLEQQSL